jgi:hypothetical protein
MVATGAGAKPAETAIDVAKPAAAAAAAPAKIVRKKSSSKAAAEADKKKQLSEKKIDIVSGGVTATNVDHPDTLQQLPCDSCRTV